VGVGAEEVGESVAEAGGGVPMVVVVVLVPVAHVTPLSVCEVDA
jgi:hypothetical protein